MAISQQAFGRIHTSDNNGKYSDRLLSGDYFFRIN